MLPTEIRVKIWKEAQLALPNTPEYYTFCLSIFTEESVARDGAVNSVTACFNPRQQVADSTLEQRALVAACHEARAEVLPLLGQQFSFFYRGTSTRRPTRQGSVAIDFNKTGLRLDKLSPAYVNPRTRFETITRGMEHFGQVKFLANGIFAGDETGFDFNDYLERNVDAWLAALSKLLEKLDKAFPGDQPRNLRSDWHKYRIEFVSWESRM